MLADFPYFVKKLGAWLRQFLATAMLQAPSENVLLGFVRHGFLLQSWLMAGKATVGRPFYQLGPQESFYFALATKTKAGPSRRRVARSLMVKPASCRISNA
jgi:hypothetical protein